MTPGQPFVRDRPTWLAYWMLGYGAYTLGLLGPLMPFLREERDLSYTLGGVLTTAAALGTIVSGLSSDRLANRWGRRRVFWLAAAGVALGAAALAFSPTFLMLVSSVLVLGFCSSLTLTAVQATLSDRHGDQRGIAYSESNVVAALITSLGPLCIGGFQRLGVGWRGALFVPILTLALLRSLYGRETLAEGAPSSAGAVRGGGLPVGYWAFWAVIVLVVAIEWCLIVWGADYLAGSVGLSKVNASTAMGIFFGAMLVGRVAGSSLARRLPSTTLLLVALSVTAVGFPVFWLARLATLNLMGLFVTGLGVASLFPFALSVAVGSAPGQANLASARVSLGVGVAIFTAPLLLGWAADRLGLQTAYGLVAVLTVLAMVMTFMARRLTVELAAPLPA